MAPKPFKSLRVLASLVLGLVACADPSIAGPDGDEEPIRVVHQFPSFRVHIHETFVRTGCTDSGCHGIGQAGLTLTSDDIPANYAELVNVPAESEPFLRVVPFDAQNSYVVIKLEGRNVVGSQMPVGTPFDTIDLRNVRNWIDNGAPNN